MKKIGLLSIILLITFLTSCKEDAPKDYAKISGTIKNANVKKITIKGRTGYAKTIVLNDDGTFSDTLHLNEKGDLFLFSVKKPIRIYLKNNDDIKLNANIDNFIESIKFSGNGSETNNYLAEKTLWQSKINVKELFQMKEADFKAKSSMIVSELTALLKKHNNIDDSFYKEEEKALAGLPAMLDKQYNQGQSRTNNSSTSSFNGKKSPEFNNYENFSGGKTSLKDLSGKYVYIDIWATWCRPCLGEIPHLQKLEEAFKGKKIHFVSISIDRENAKSKWKKMIADKKMGGIQLFAIQNDSFIKAYKVNSIPRFILIDPKGNVVNDKMSRPSNPQTKELLTKLLK